MKWLLFIIAFGACCSIVTAQGTSKALKFDEFTDESTFNYAFDDDVTFGSRVERFAKFIKLRKARKAFIIYYRSRVLMWGGTNKASSLAISAQWKIVGGTSLKPENVEVIDGGIREHNTLEFWFGKATAIPPKPAPTFGPDEKVDCPTIYVNSDGPHFDVSKPITFRAYVYPEAPYNVNWRISTGVISRGQGTDTIQVQVNGPDRITATAKLSNVPEPCVDSGIATITIGRKPYLFDEANRYNESSLRARLDSFLARVYEDTTVNGVMIVYGMRSRGMRGLDAVTKLVRSHLAFRKFPTGRITIIEGGYREFPSIEMWLVQPDMEFPEPTPTVDSTAIEHKRSRK